MTEHGQKSQTKTQEPGGGPDPLPHFFNVIKSNAFFLLHAQVGAKKQGLAWQGSQIHGGRRNAVELREPWRSRVEGS